MFDRYYKSQHVTWLRATPFAKQIGDFCCHLHNRGHARTTIRHYMREAVRFLTWAEAKGLRLGAVDERTLRQFSRKQIYFEYRQARAGGVPVALRHLLQVLRSNGYLPPAKAPLPDTIDGVIADYDCHLSETCGLAVDTRISRRRFSREFLRLTFGARAIRWERLRPKHLSDFVTGFGRSGRIASAVVAASALRSFLRWLVLNGRCDASLARAIPHFHRCKYGSLPTVMSDQQVRRFLAAFDRSTRRGRRDFAMAVCQADLGLRVGEVAALTMDDIDWRSATIRIRESKTRRGRVLPLTHRVGHAIAAYLRRGRPTTPCRHLFIRETFPVGSAVSRAIILKAYGRAFATVKGCEGWRRSHVLRYAAATRMHRQGASLKAIADILGHQCLDTTASYTRVDKVRLAAVALPWPKEVRS